MIKYFIYCFLLSTRKAAENGRFEMFDPVKLTESTIKTISRDGERKYYRFRSSRFYGGISTADCVGCNLRCVFCWARSVVTKPRECGRFYRPEDVAGNLLGIAGKKRLKQLRISGNEPTLARRHLIRVLEIIGERRPFILETNGILIGDDEGYAKELSKFENLYVRVSLKGACEEEFSRLTGAVPEGFLLQLKALENLLRYDVKTHPACMISFSPPENIIGLRKRLKEIHPSFEEFETEELILYPGIEERLKKENIGFFTAYAPQNVPKEEV